MKMNSTTRAKSPLVALVVLALLFVGFSAVAYPTLSSEGDEPTRENDPDGRNYALADDENSNVLIRGIGGYIFKDTQPVPGVVVTLVKQEIQHAPPERPNPDGDIENDRYPGTRGETDRDPDRDTKRDTDPDAERKTEKDCDRSKDKRYTDADKKPTDMRVLSDKETERYTDKHVTKTDRSGYFEFLGLDRGQYLLVIYYSDKAVHRQVIKYAGTGSSPFRIILGRDARPEARPETESYLVKGKVVDERKQPIAGARVQLTRLVQVRENDRERPNRDTDQRPGSDRKPGIDRKSDAVRPQFRATTTDRQGNFHFEGVPGGAYVLTVEARDFLPHKSMLRVHENTRAPVQLKHLPAKERQTLNLKAEVVAKDRDGLFNDVIIYAFSSQGKPLARVKIYIDREFIGATDGKGMIISKNYRQGTHNVIGSYEYHRASTTFTIRGSDPRPDPDPEPRPEPDNEHREYGTLKGIVFAENAHVPGAVIEIVNDDFHFRAQSNDHGEFVIERIPVGIYRIFAFAEGYQKFRGEVRIGEDGTSYRIKLEPRESEPHPEVGYLHGLVSTVGGYPIVRAQVMVHNDDNRYTTTTDKEGKFGFELLEGEFILLIQAEGFQPYEGEILIKAGERMIVEIVLDQLR